MTDEDICTVCGEVRRLHATHGDCRFTAEEWRTVPGHPDYDVSSLGRVLSRKRGTPHFMSDKPHPKTGYIFARLDNKSYGIHCVVALTWHGPCPEGMEVDHINEIRNDNRPENLRYLTKQENLARRAWAEATECSRGHELSGDNLYVRPSTGRRECRACKKHDSANFRARAAECSVDECKTRGEVGTRAEPLCQTHYRRLRSAQKEASSSDVAA